MSENKILPSISQKFQELHKKIEKCFEIFGIEPMQNSIAAIELSSKYSETINSAYNHGTRLIEVASDNLTAFSREIIEPVLPFALYATIRSVLETASISIWLLDDNIKLNERISRSYAYRCRSLEQLKKFSIVTNNQDTIKHAEKRYNYAIQQAKKLGITRKNKIGEDILVSEMPNFTDMVSTQLNQEILYRLFSAMTHADHWALIGLGFISVVDIPDGKLQKKDIKIGLIINLALIGLNAFKKQIVCKCRLFGWPVEEIEAAFAVVKNSLLQYAKS